MENKTKDLITWALNEFKDQLVLNEQRWDFFPKQPFYDYRSSLKINDKTYEGRGVALSQKQAITVCIAEALERFAINYQNKKYTSNGCAIHTEMEQAKVNSRRELIERHFIMLYSLGYANAEDISLDIVPNNLKSSINFLVEKNIKVKFYQLYSSANDKVVLCRISGLESSPKFGMTFGSSCKNSLEDSLTASYLEALPNAIAYLNQNIIPMTLGEFKKNLKPQPVDHLSLYLDFEFAVEYSSRVRINLLRENDIDSNLFLFEELQYPYSEMLPVIRSTHPDCLAARWGLLPDNFNPENLNPDFPLVLP